MTFKQTEKQTQTLVSIGLPPDTLNKIDEIRGDIPRSAYLRKKIISIIETSSQKEKQPACSQF